VPPRRPSVPSQSQPVKPMPMNMVEGCKGEHLLPRVACAPPCSMPMKNRTMRFIYILDLHLMLFHRFTILSSFLIFQPPSQRPRAPDVVMLGDMCYDASLAAVVQRLVHLFPSFVPPLPLQTLIPPEHCSQQ